MSRPWLQLCKPLRAPFRDGTTVLVRNLITALPLEVEVAYFGDPARPLRPIGDSVIAAAAMPYQPSVTDKLARLAQAVSPRLGHLPIHAWFAANPSSSRALAGLRRLPRRRPVVHTLPASTGAEAIVDSLARVDRVVVTSDWGRARLIAAGLADDRVARIHPGLTVPDPAPGPAIHERRSLLYAGDLEPDVGERLIAVAEMLRDHAPWRLTIASRPKGEAHARVRAELARRLGTDIDRGRVELFGEVADIDALFDRAAVQLYLAHHARRKVDLPLALLEGLARGVPVAIVDADPVAELLAVAREACLDVGVALDPHRFTDAVRTLPELLEDRERLTAMADAAPRLVRRRFSAARAAERYRRYYLELA